MLHYVKKPRSSWMSLMCLAASLLLKCLFQLGSGERDPWQFRNIYQIPSKWPSSWMLFLWARLQTWESAGSLADAKLKTKSNCKVPEFLVTYPCAQTVKGSGPGLWKLRTKSSKKLSSRSKINGAVLLAPFSVLVSLGFPGHLFWLSDYDCGKLDLGGVFLPHEWESVRNIKNISKYLWSQMGSSDEFSQGLGGARGSLIQWHS